MNAEAILPDASQCANCGAAAVGNFCHDCGQETTLHVPSAREFLHEFVGHYVALEGKLWKTLGLLLFKPGRLTRAYLEGRRVRYVQPLRLYLTLSIIFFALFKYGGHEVIHFGDEKPAAVSAAAASDGAKAAPRTTIAGDKDSDLHNALAAISPRLAQKADAFDQLSREQKIHQINGAFFAYAPYAVFCLMPVFALYLKLLYFGSGRRYGEHLLFALHSNAFAFLMLSLLLELPPGVPYVGKGLGLWLVFYLPTAMRKVYGGGRIATALRWLLLMLLHLLSMVVAIAAAVFLGAIA